MSASLSRLFDTTNTSSAPTDSNPVRIPKLMFKGADEKFRLNSCGLFFESNALGEGHLSVMSPVFVLLLVTHFPLLFVEGSLRTRLTS